MRIKIKGKRMTAWAALLALSMASCPFDAYAATSRSSSVMPKYTMLQELGIFSGFDDGTARLEEEMTREQFATVLMKLTGLEPVAETNSYQDVDKARWSSGAIEAITKAGFMNGVADRKFSPEDHVTFEQLAAILVRAYNIKIDTKIKPPALGQASPWAKLFVAAAVSQGLIVPQVDFTKPATRADLVDASYVSYQMFPKKTNQSGSTNQNGSPSDGTGQTGSPGSPTGGAGQTDSGAGQPGNSGGTPGQTPDTAAAEVSVKETKATGPRTVIVTFSDGGQQTVDYPKGLPYGIPLTLTVSYKRKSYPVTITYFKPEEASQPTTAPKLAGAVSLGGNKLIADFEEPAGRLDPAFFKVQASDGKAIKVTEIKRYSFGKSAVLTLASSLSLGVSYTLIGGDRASFFTVIATDWSKPFVQSAVITDNTTVLLLFNKLLDPDSAALRSNYAISGLTVNTATLSEDGTSVTLNTSPIAENKPYYLSVFRVYDVTGNYISPGLPIHIRGKDDVVTPDQAG